MLISREELEITTERRGAPGGQHVGTASCVVITHLPTELTVKVCEHRSQYKNREAAIRLIEFYLTDPENV